VAAKIKIICPDCKAEREVTKGTADRRKSDRCQPCYRKMPACAGPRVAGEKPVIPTIRSKPSDKIVQAMQLVAAGVPVGIAGKETGVPPGVITQAIAQATSLKSLADGIKETLADQWYTLAQIALNSIADVDLLMATAKDKASIAKMATEQARVMEGKPTEIVAQYKLVLEKYMTVMIPAPLGATSSEVSLRVPGVDSPLGMPEQEVVDVEHVDMAETSPDGGAGDRALAADLVRQYAGESRGSGDGGDVAELSPASAPGPTASVDADAGAGGLPGPIWLKNRRRVSAGDSDHPLVGN